MQFILYYAAEPMVCLAWMKLYRSLDKVFIMEMLVYCQWFEA